MQNLVSLNSTSNEASLPLTLIKIKKEPAKLTVWFWRLFVLFFSEIRVFVITFLTVFATNILRISALNMVNESFLSSSLALDIISLTVFLAKVGSLFMILLNALDNGFTNAEDLNKDDKRISKFLAVLLAVFLGFSLGSLLTLKEVGYSLKSSVLISAAVALVSSLRLERSIKETEKELTSFNYRSLKIGLALLVLVYILVFSLNQNYLFLCALPLGLTSLLGTAFLFHSLPQTELHNKALVYIVCWLLALSITIGFNYLFHVKEISQEQSLNYPQTLQLITKDNLEALGSNLQPEIKTKALQSRLQENQVDVLVVPYSFYKKAKEAGLEKKERNRGGIISLDKRYQAIFIYPANKTANYKEAVYEDFLELNGKKVKLSFVFDTSGPLLNSDKFSGPILVLSDLDFRSTAKRQEEAFLSIGIWQNENLAQKVENAGFNFSFNFSSNKES
ncbi:MAG TPA: hypothetical protein GX522_07490, partial [Firmicutes bacterium]|nr:hypothetical protein [Bacillota bacterium]